MASLLESRHALGFETTMPACFLWRRLDQPGHDCCRLLRGRDGWRLSGTAVFREGRRHCQVRYEVATDRRWHTRWATVDGFIDHRPVDLRLEHQVTGWSLNGVVHHGLDHPDVDLGFTPATNLIPLRRLGLVVGQQADAPAAYLEFPHLRLVDLPQQYRRIDRERYAYRSPTAGYHGVLRVSPVGAVIDYPRVFRLVTTD